MAPRNLQLALLIPAVASLALCRGRAQAATDGATYYSQGNLAANAPASWNAARLGGGSAPAGFSAGDVFVIQAGHAMSTTAAWAVSGTGAAIVIEPGGALTANHLVAVPSFQVQNGGLYVHNAAGSSPNGSAADLPGSAGRTFGPTSTVEIQRWANGGTAPAALPGAAWGNLTLNVASLGGSWNQAGGLQAVSGTLALLATGGGAREFRLSGTTPYTLALGGDLVLAGGSLNLSSGSGGGPFAMNIGGSFSQTGATFRSDNATALPIMAFTGGAAEAVAFTAVPTAFVSTRVNWRIDAGKAVTLRSNFGAGGWVAAGRTMSMGGELVLGAGGDPGPTGTWVYGPGARLGFDTGATLSVDASDPWWPPTSGPAHVAIRSGSVSAPPSTRAVAGDLSIDPGASFALAGGDLRIGGAFTVGGGFASQGRSVIFDGGAPQVLAGSGSPVLAVLALSNTWGLTLATGVDITGSLTLSNGRIHLGSNGLSLGPGAVITGPFDASRMIVADGAGELRRSVVAPGVFSFPVGDAGGENGTPDYSPFTVTLGAGTAFTPAPTPYLAVRVTNASHPNNVLSPRLRRYWTVRSSGLGPVEGAVEYAYIADDVLGSEAALYGTRYDAGEWTILNAVDLAARTLGGPVTGFSDFTGGNQSLPVSLAFFQASRRGDPGGPVDVEWQTATQLGTVGFNLYAASAEGRRRLNPQVVVATRPDSLTPQTYHFSTSVEGGSLWLEALDILGGSQLHGPFQIGAANGARLGDLERGDWGRAREAQHHVTRAASPLTRGDQIELSVARSGIQRVTYEALLAAGADLSGTASAFLAVTQAGNPVPRYIHGAAHFGPGSFVEFVAEVRPTLYTDRAVYRLSVDPTRAVPVQEDDAPPDDASAAPDYYTETAQEEGNRMYGFASPTGDPWYEAGLLAFDSPQERAFTITVDHALTGRPAQLTVAGWGGTDWAGIAPDHRLEVDLNGVPVAANAFDGVRPFTVAVDLPAGVLVSGANVLTLRLPGDTGAAWDVVNVDSYALRYARQFVPRLGRLSFDAAGDAFEVRDLDPGLSVAYRISPGGAARLRAWPAAEGIRLRGVTEPAHYLIAGDDAIDAPEVYVWQPREDVTQGDAPYLIIAHPDLADAVAPLAAFHTARGAQTRVVEVTDIYAHPAFGDGSVDPLAIKRYVTYAHERLGTRAVLLVGGDTYDYLDHLGLGGFSHIPSLYAQTDELVRFAPSDALFVDLDDDGVPDLPIGRLPARTKVELEVLVSKVASYASKPYTTRAVFASDVTDGFASYQSESRSMSQSLPPGWQVAFADADSGVAQAHVALVAGIDSGAALVNFIGHSGPSAWSFQNLFSAEDAMGLANAGRPALVMQWGCWNTYYVEPHAGTLAHTLLLAGDRGAAAVLGAATITQFTSDRALGREILARIAEPGVTVGEAVLQAKQALAARKPGLRDAQLGWTLLGDPMMMVTPRSVHRVYIPVAGRGEAAPW